MPLEWTNIPGPAGRLACWTRGSGNDDQTPVFFVHPINLQGACWVEVVRHLSGRYCIMPDLRGHGGSEAIPPYGVEGWAADCLAVMDHFDIERAHFVGGSLGGPIAVHLAAEYPSRVASVASFGGALAIEGEDPEAVNDILQQLGTKGMFRSVLPTISVGPDTNPVTMEWILALANPNDVGTVDAIWRATLAADVRPHVSSVEVPVLVANGEFDRTCTPDQGREMADAFGTKLRILPGVGHLPMCEAPELVAFVISEHLDQIGISGGGVQ